MTRVAINGFGRIGRLVLRALYENPKPGLKVVAINDLGSVQTNSHLLKFDSVHGIFSEKITDDENSIYIGNDKIDVFAERDPKKLPWKSLDIDVVLECTGIFAKRDLAAQHLTAGAKKVLVSAPCQDADYTVVYGVNHDGLQAGHEVVSNASCTTNCLAPVAYVLDQLCGIEHGYMTTIHAYTGDQPVLDTMHKDLRRARAAALSMIPTSTGAAKAVGLVLPHLAGKLDGTSVRVPTPNVSMIDLVFTPKKETSAEELNEAVKKASESDRFMGILGYNTLPLVSTDFNHNFHSSVFDATQTQVMEGKLCRVLSWYDNEWGFSNRMLDTCHHISQL